MSRHSRLVFETEAQRHVNYIEVSEWLVDKIKEESE
ncbi:hypothetical protein SEA_SCOOBYDOOBYDOO_231 [Mycobacterium phage ScoobyDoobyDoo]|nr:hypothetical protein SEA_SCOOBYDOOBYDOO_231 [Mycobacterium phage ScoobyDoobyDoo]